MPHRISRQLHKLRDLIKNNRGSAMIMVTVAIVAMFAFAVLAIDGAILMTSRTQLHSASDAAALAGASALIGGTQADAVDRAVNFASYNEAVEDDMKSVVITADDVEFPQPDICRVTTHRTSATGDPIRTYFLRVIDALHGGTADMTATSAAQAFDVCASQCLKPWAIPDRWNDANANGEWDAGELYDPDGTGYVAPVDVGMSITLKTGSPKTAMEPGIFYPVNYPPIDSDQGSPLTGGAWYREFISGCAPFEVGIGDRLQLEPGNMVGPTTLGMDELIAADPNATWDAGTNQVVNSAFGLSPRIALVPMFDPTLPPTSGRNYVTVSKIAAFFLESVGPGSQVNGRFIQITAQGQACEGGLGSGLVKGVVLVE